MILAVSPRNDLYLAAEQGQGAVERLGAYTGRLFGVAAKGVGIRGGGVEGRGPCACPEWGRRGRGQAQGPLVHPAPLLVPTVGARLLGEREGTAGQAQGLLVRPTPLLVPTVGARLVW